MYDEAKRNKLLPKGKNNGWFHKLRSVLFDFNQSTSSSTETFDPPLKYIDRKIQFKSLSDQANVLVRGY